MDDLLVTSTWDVRAHSSSQARFVPLTFLPHHQASKRLADSEKAWRGLLYCISVPVLRDCHLHHTIQLCESRRMSFLRRGRAMC